MIPLNEHELKEVVVLGRKEKSYQAVCTCGEYFVSAIRGVAVGRFEFHAGQVELIGPA